MLPSFTQSISLSIRKSLKMETNKTPSCEIRKSKYTGKYSVWLYHLIASGDEKNIVCAPLVFTNGLYLSGVGSTIPALEFDTENAATSAYKDYRKRNPTYKQQQEAEFEVVKEIFED